MASSTTSRKTPSATSNPQQPVASPNEDKDMPTGAIKVKIPTAKKENATSSQPGSPSTSVLDGTSSQNYSGSNTTTCKHCKQTVDKSLAPAHMKQCLKLKQERQKKKKDAKDGTATKEQDKEGDIAVDEPSRSKSVELENSISDKSKTANESVIKDAVESSAKKGKKRKAEGEVEKAPKKQKKKDEPKAKAPKLKGPVDVEKQCGVPLPNGAMCARSLTCKSHAMGAKRAVPGRSLPYDMLLAQYQKKNQAKQQKAAIDANAPLQDDIDAAGSGPVDSDEEKDAVMAGIARARPQPLFVKSVMSARSKYQYIRLKEMLHNALGGSRGAGLFSTTASTELGRNIVFGGSGESGGNALPLDPASDTFSRRPSMAQRVGGTGVRKQSTPGAAA